MSREKQKQATRCRYLDSGRILAFACLTILLPAFTIAADDMVGTWLGEIPVSGGTSGFALILEKPGTGDWSGVLKTSPESDDTLPLESLSISGSAISLSFRLPGAEKAAFFSGNYQSWNDAIKGVLIGDAGNVPLRLDRLGAAPSAELAAAEGDTVGYGEEDIVVIKRHEHHFGISGHFGIYTPVYILKEQARNINDITTSETGFDVAARWYLLDAFALFGRYVSSGLKFDSNEKNLALFEGIGINSNSYLEFSGFEVGMTVYIGPTIMKNSKMNPYISGFIGQMDWSLGSDGKGSEPITILDVPLEGKDVVAGGGFGLEYPFGDRIALEAEWIWRYLLTEDKALWAETDTQWTNTHTWSLSLGLLLQF